MNTSQSIANLFSKSQNAVADFQINPNDASLKKMIDIKPDSQTGSSIFGAYEKAFEIANSQKNISIFDSPSARFSNDETADKKIEVDNKNMETPNDNSNTLKSIMEKLNELLKILNGLTGVEETEQTEETEATEQIEETKQTNSNNEVKIESPEELAKYGIDVFDVEDRDVFVSTNQLGDTIIKVKDKEGRIRTGYVYSKNFTESGEGSYVEYTFDSQGNPKTARKFYIATRNGEVVGGPSSPSTVEYAVSLNPDGWFLHNGYLHHSKYGW